MEQYKTIGEKGRLVNVIQLPDEENFGITMVRRMLVDNHLDCELEKRTVVLLTEKEGRVSVCHPNDYLVIDEGRMIPLNEEQFRSKFKAIE